MGCSRSTVVATTNIVLPLVYHPEQTSHPPMPVSWLGLVSELFLLWVPPFLLRRRVPWWSVCSADTTPAISWFSLRIALCILNWTVALKGCSAVIAVVQLRKSSRRNEPGVPTPCTQDAVLLAPILFWLIPLLFCSHPFEINVRHYQRPNLCT